MLSLLFSPRTASRCLRPSYFRVASVSTSAALRRSDTFLLHRRHLPRLARFYSDHRKPDGTVPENIPSSSEKEKDPKVLSFLKELEKEGGQPYGTSLEKDAASSHSPLGTPKSQPNVEKDTGDSEKAHLGPTYRSELYKEDPTLEQPRYEDEVGKPKIWPQIGFACFVASVIWVQAGESTNFDTKRAISVFPNAFVISSEHLRRLRLNALSDRLKKGMQTLKDSLSGLPNTLSFPILWSYVQLANGYINASEGKRAAYQICAVNGVIWLMWQFRFLTPFMSRHFLHHPLSGKSLTLLTSMFSHKSFIHLAFNSFALVGFGSAASSYLVKKQAENKDGLLESTPKYHFWAMYLTAGLFSGLVSHVVAARLTFPRILAQLRNSEAITSATAGATHAFRRAASAARTKATDVKAIHPSLGASGAIYATVTMTALAFPDAQIFLLFLPIPMPITWGVAGMCAMDILGIIRGWRIFDHWAHLGGALFGVFYYKFGPDFWNQWRLNEREKENKSS